MLLGQPPGSGEENDGFWGAGPKRGGSGGGTPGGGGGKKATSAYIDCTRNPPIYTVFKARFSTLFTPPPTPPFFPRKLRFRKKNTRHSESCVRRIRTPPPNCETSGVFRENDDGKSRTGIRNPQHKICLCANTSMGGTTQSSMVPLRTVSTVVSKRICLRQYFLIVGESSFIGTDAQLIWVRCCMWCIRYRPCRSKASHVKYKLFFLTTINIVLNVLFSRSEPHRTGGPQAPTRS